jgi:hypothetical protein
MNHDTDRVAVPTNGRKPHPVPDAVDAADDPADDAADDAAPRDPVAKVTSPELTIAVNPAQLAVGFGVIAAVILLLLGRHRGRRKG